VVQTQRLGPLCSGRSEPVTFLAGPEQNLEDPSAKSERILKDIHARLAPAVEHEAEERQTALKFLLLVADRGGPHYWCLITPTGI
jgi:hypothetical protein